jgi:hypothetical protein
VWVFGVFFGGFWGRFGCLIGFLWGASFVSWVYDGVCWGLLMYFGFHVGLSILVGFLGFFMWAS